MDLVFKSFRVKKRRVGDARIRWWDINKEKAAKLSEKIKREGSWKLIEDADAMWERMAQCIRRSAKELLGVSK